MQKRIFIAINLPDNVKNKLLECQAWWPDLPCRWTKKENLHITLIFLGYLTDEDLIEVLKITRTVVSRHGTFFINLNKIIYGPTQESRLGAGKVPPKMPRMVWVEGEKNDYLGNFQWDLENALASSEAVVSQQTDSGDDNNKTRAYSPHITLGRLKEWEFKKIEPEERPQIEQEISISFEVSSIEVMESSLKKSGPEYTVLESISLEKITL